MLHSMNEVARLRAAHETERAALEREREGRLVAETKLEKAKEALEKAKETLEKTEEALRKQNKRVGECIQNSTFTTKPFLPKWGDPLLAGELEMSTTTNKAWLELGPDNVTHWMDEKLVAFLQEADAVTVDRDGEQIPILRLIKEGKADKMLQDLLNGSSAADAASSGQRVRDETFVEDMLSKYLWTPLQSLMQGNRGTASSDSFPIKKYARLTVSPGSNHAGVSFVPMPPQYASFYKVDRSIDYEYHPSGLSVPRLQFPDVLESDKEDSVEDDDIRRHSRVAVEIMPDVLCPKVRLNGGIDQDAKNRAYGGNLVDYIKSPHFDPKFNPLAQAVTYGYTTRTKCLMIHTLNRMTLGLILDDDPTRIQVLLSKKFDSTVSLPFTSSVPPTHPAASWSLWEAKFKERQDLSRSESKKRSQPGQNEPDTALGESDVDSARGRDKKSPHGYALAPFAYADLWAPLRFAIPATHSIEQESTTRRLDGDAELIGYGRIGPVYRHTLQGRDVAVKLLVLTVKREIDDLRMYPHVLRKELSNEVDVYKHLRSLQGKTIPVLLWHGTLIEGMADALATEYCGSQLPEELSEEEKVSAMQALDSLHENGVLHGDVAARNFVCKDNQIRILDFGFAQFRSRLTEEEWLDGVKMEKMLLREELEI